MTTKNKFIFLVLTIVCLLLFFVLFPDTYDLLSREDNVFEYLTALFLAWAGVLLLLSVKVTKKSPVIIRVLLFFIGLVFIVTACEEISWGQRLFGIATPEYLQEVNGQNELNFHNIDKTFFDRLVDRVIILFVLIGTVLLFNNKDRFMGIKYPDVAIICSFSFIPFYNQYNSLDFDFYHLIYICLFALFYRVYRKDRSQIWIVLLTLVITLIIPLVHTHFHHLFPLHNNSANEYREFLFGLVTLFYAYEIYKGFLTNDSVKDLRPN